MKHFKKPDGSIHAFAEDYEGDLITPDMSPASDEEVAAAGAIPYAAVRDIELSKFRTDRKEMFSVIVGMGWAASESGDTATVTKLLAFREGLKDLPEWPAVMAATTHAGLKSAMSARYKTLVGALPEAIKLDFVKLYKS